MGTLHTFWQAARIALAIGATAAATAATAAPLNMVTGRQTTQPVGHYEFCLRYTEECQQRTARSAPVELTRKVWATIVEVNNAVNAAVTPKTDQEIWGIEELWSYPDGVGDCEDYVLEKRRQLMKAGLPAGSLLITVVRQKNGDGHAVLTVRTSLGDFILDNMETRVLGWAETDYQFLKRQSERNSGVWVAIDDDRQIPVGSIR